MPLEQKMNIKEGLGMIGALLIFGLSGCQDPGLSISSVQNDDLNPTEAVPNPGEMTDTTPYIYGVAGANYPYNKNFFINVYIDGMLYDTAKINAARTEWYVKPNLSVGTHTIQAAYLDDNGAGKRGPAWTLTIRSPGPAIGLPHTGVKKCYVPGSNTLTACFTPTVFAFSNTQDGWRQTVTPPSYSQVGVKSGGTYSITECVKDNITGLMWEGKTNSGARAGSLFYHNLDSTQSPQKGDTHYPSESDIAAINNSVGYKNAVNAMQLCGFSDWRIPTAQELETLVDLGTGTLNTTWFPNSNFARPYWTSTAHVVDASSAWGVYFNDGAAGGISTLDRYTNALPLRLVRSGISATQK
jgi:hypothetical protein